MSLNKRRFPICPECGCEEVFILTKWRRGSKQFCCYDCGHTWSCPRTPSILDDVQIKQDLSFSIDRAELTIQVSLPRELHESMKNKFKAGEDYLSELILDQLWNFAPWSEGTPFGKTQEALVN